jgi:hypothetical protein
MWTAAQYQQQYLAYMQRLIQQYTWAQSYVSPMQSYMQQYANSYNLSEPFAMESIRSLYSYGNSDRSRDDLVIGINRNSQTVQTKSKAVRLLSAISDIAEKMGWTSREKERSSGPQSNSMPKNAYLGGRTVGGVGYDTVNGAAMASASRFRDQDSGATGSLVIFDTGKGKEMRLVELEA